MKLKEISFTLFLIFLITITPIIMDKKVDDDIKKLSNCKIVITEKGMIQSCNVIDKLIIKEMQYNNDLSKSFLILTGLFLGLWIIGKDIKGVY